MRPCYSELLQFRGGKLTLIPRLVKRGAVFYYRMTVPKQLVARVGRMEISSSLRTVDPSEARLRCRELSNALDRFFMGLPRMIRLSQVEIEALIRDYFQTLLNRSAETIMILPDDPRASVEEQLAFSLRDMEDTKRQLSTGKFSNIVNIQSLNILGVEPSTVFNKDFSKVVSEEFLQTQRMVARAMLESDRIYVAQLRGDYGDTDPRDPLFRGMRANGLPPIPGDVVEAPKSPPTLAWAIGQYLSHKKPSWEKKTSAAVEKALRNAEQVIGGGTLLQLIANADVVRFRDVLSRIPPNFSKLKKFDGMTLDEVAENNKGGAVLSPKSQKKDLDFLHAFLSWATDEGHFDKQPGSKIKIIANKKGAPAKDRDPYSSDQIKEIFQSPIYKGCLSEHRRATPGSEVIKDGKYWVPIIALYSGLRLGDIVQLLAKDIVEEDGIVYFDITKTEDEDKQIKTQSSYRRVPVHKRLIELGLLSKVPKVPKDRIFADIAQGKDGYYSHNFSKFWSRYVRQIKVFSPKTAFQSLRHNFKDGLTHAGVTEVVAKALMGHSDKSVHDSYGSGPSLKMLKEGIDKIAFEHAL